MAKARANGTPAKKASPAKHTKSQTATPAKGRSRRTSDTPMSRTVPTRSQSPVKTSTRRQIKSPASVDRATTRSQSPAKAITRQSSVHPAIKETSRTRSKSPAKPARKRTRSPFDKAEPGSSTSKRTRAASPVKAAADPLVSSYARSKSPAKAASDRPVSIRARSKSPAKSAASKSHGEPYPRPYPAKKGRGTIISSTNPQMIAELNKRNPFHETLPAPEVWHRNMPPYFPFGETPYMESVISQRIDEDLQRGMRETREAAQKNDGMLQTIGRWGSDAMSWGKAKVMSPPKPRMKYPSPWDLPPVGGRNGATAEASSSGSRRLSGSQSRASSLKKKPLIQRRRDEDEDDDENDDLPFL